MDDTPEYLDPAKWAAMLGLVPSLDPTLQIPDETERERVFLLRFNPHLIWGPATEDIQWSFVWAEFTAKYLHLLVDRLLDLPPPSDRVQEDGILLDYPIHNMYHTVLRYTHCGYWARFMSSSHTSAKGCKLLRVMAERLVEWAPNWCESLPMYEGYIQSTVSTLMLMVISAKENLVPDETKTKLANWLHIWAVYESWSPEVMVPPNHLPQACLVLSCLLQIPVVMKPATKRLRHVLTNEVCGLLTCDAETNLKTCARCKTVAYVRIVSPGAGFPELNHRKVL